MALLDEPLKQRAERLAATLEREGHFIHGPTIVTTKTGRGLVNFNKLQPRDVSLRYPIKDRFPDLRGSVWGALSLSRPYRFAKAEALGLVKIAHEQDFDAVWEVQPDDGLYMLFYPFLEETPERKELRQYVEKAVERFQQFPEVLEIGLLGSLTQSEKLYSHDLDLYLVLQTEEPLADLQRAANKLFGRIPTRWEVFCFLKAFAGDAYLGRLAHRYSRLLEDPPGFRFRVAEVSHRQVLWQRERL